MPLRQMRKCMGILPILLFMPILYCARTHNVLLQNRRGQSGLWGNAISGDLPIVILQIGDSSNIELVRQMVQAHAYWRLKGLAVDLVIWNEALSGYQQLLQEQIIGLITASIQGKIARNSGEIFVRPAEQISNEERILLQSVARVIISDRRGIIGKSDQSPYPHRSSGCEVYTD